MILKKIFFIFFPSLFAFPAFSQINNGEKYFVDYYEKAANSNTRYYSIKTSKKNDADLYWQREMYYTDTIDGAIASKGKSKDAAGLIKEGDFIYYYKNGVKKEAGNFINNIKEGEWKAWDEQGKLESTNHFKKGKMAGRNISWYDNGAISDSTVLDENGNGKSFSFYKDGNKDGEGNYKRGDKNGTWIYYYRDVKNQKSIEINYEMDSVKNYQCYTENGALQTKDCVYEREAVFRGGDEGWKKYLIKKLTDKSGAYSKYLKPNQLYTVIIKFVVNKEGNTADIKVENPRIEEVDALAIKIIENSPKWIPAVQYNNKINAYRRQPISFLGPE
jgi:antitoxin component YwqK of YwqJK toxin-antitoxin module